MVAEARDGALESLVIGWPWRTPQEHLRHRRCTEQVTLQIYIDIVTMPASRNRSTIAHSFGV
jgi:hypothetical protein